MKAHYVQKKKQNKKRAPSYSQRRIPEEAGGGWRPSFSCQNKEVFIDGVPGEQKFRTPTPTGRTGKRKWRIQKAERALEESSSASTVNRS